MGRVSQSVMADTSVCVLNNIYFTSLTDSFPSRLYDATLFHCTIRQRDTKLESKSEEERKMDDFSITSELNGNVTIVTVSGRVDSVTAASMDAELAKIEHNNKKIVLDLKDVAYISSAGIRAIVKVLQSTQKAGGGVKLANMPTNVVEVLETVGMMQMLEAYPTVDEAVASF